MNDASRGLGAVRVLLTVVALEFFGPIFRDFSASHAFNPTWVGHARVHLVWLLGFMAFSGIANVYLIWFRRPKDSRDLWLSVAWQSCNLGGFWLAYLLAPVYQGEMTMPGFHVHILGIDENVFAFSVLSILLVISTTLLARESRSQPPRATS